MAARKKREVTPEEKLESALIPTDKWPYEIPDNWCWVNAGLLATIHRGVSYKKPDVRNTPSEKTVLILRGGNIGEGTIEIETDNVYVDESLVSPSQIIRKGDIIIVASTGSTKVIGRAGVSSKNYTDVAFGAFLMLVRPINEIHQEYLGYYFQSMFYRNRIRQLAAGVNINNIRADYITSMPIALPPLHEQRRIASRIEWLFAKLDDAETELCAVINSSEQRQAAVLQKAFSGELSKGWRLEHGITLDSWNSTTIGECCNVGSGGTPSRKNPSYYEGNIPWIKTGEISWGHVVETEEHITQEAIENSSAKLYKPGAILVAMYGMGQTRGKAAFLDIFATTNQAVCVLEPHEELEKRFLFYFFKRNYWDIRAQSIGGNQLNLSATILKRYRINLPTVDEQNCIADLLDAVLSYEARIVQAAEEAIERIHEARQTILAKALCGELGTNDPGEPSSKELLASIYSGNTGQ